MKKILVASIILNIIFLPLGSIYLIRKYQFHKSQAAQAAVISTPQFPPFYYKINKQWEQFKTMYDVLPGKGHQTVFFGNSLVADCSWGELLGKTDIINRGIGGDDTEGMLTRVGEVVKLKPAKLFIMTGTNDISLKYSDEKFTNLYQSLLDSVKSNETKIYLFSVMPRTDELSSKVSDYNLLVRKLADKNNCTYIDIYSQFVDGQGQLKKEFTNDGYHILGTGYLMWRDILKKYL